MDRVEPGTSKLAALDQDCPVNGYPVSLYTMNPVRIRIIQSPDIRSQPSYGFQAGVWYMLIEVLYLWWYASHGTNSPWIMHKVCQQQGSTNILIYVVVVYHIVTIRHGLLKKFWSAFYALQGVPPFESIQRPAYFSTTQLYINIVYTYLRLLFTMYPTYIENVHGG